MSVRIRLIIGNKGTVINKISNSNSNISRDKGDFDGIENIILFYLTITESNYIK